MDAKLPFTRLVDVDLTVERGEWVSVTGPSGAGKSTLLNIIGCLDRPTQGRYRIDGIDTGSLSDRQRAGLRSHAHRLRVSIVPSAAPPVGLRKRHVRRGVPQGSCAVVAGNVRWPQSSESISVIAPISCRPHFPAANGREWPLPGH